MSVDSERRAVQRKRDELNKLQLKYANTNGKIALLMKKINAAQASIRKTKSASIIKSKLSEIERTQKTLVGVENDSVALQKQIAQKQKELDTAEKKLLKEEERASVALQRQTASHMAEITSALDEQATRQEEMANEIMELKAPKKDITILFLASNPTTTGRLRLDAEARSIQEKIRMSNHRDTIHFETRWAVRVSDIIQAINETNPTIIHISGHGCDTGELVFEYPDGSERLVSPEAITQAISTVPDKVRLVVFNACYSWLQAKTIVEYIDASIGMSTSIGDDAVCVFAAQFYSSIGFGLSLDVAFKQAIAALVLEDIHEDQTPELYCKDGLTTSNIIFVEA